MGDRIRAELAALETAEEAFQRAYDGLRGELDRLDRDLRASLADWSGQARHAYDRAHREWTLAARDMAQQLGELHRNVVRARRNYRASLHANHGMWHPL